MTIKYKIITTIILKERCFDYLYSGYIGKNLIFFNQIFSLQENGDNLFSIR